MYWEKLVTGFAYVFLYLSGNVFSKYVILVDGKLIYLTHSEVYLQITSKVVKIYRNDFGFVND